MTYAKRALIKNMQVYMFEQNVCHSLSVNSLNQNELIQGKFGNLFFAFVKKGTLMS